MGYNFDPNELTKEKTLWDVYLLSRRIRSSRFNTIATIITIIVLSIYSFYFQSDIASLLGETRMLANLTLNLSATILGFLIAGFTIFATLSKPRMLLKMMEVVHKPTGMKFLKYNFVAFMRIFIYYLAIMSISIVMVLVGNKNGMAYRYAMCFPEGIMISCNLIKIAYVIIGTSLTLMVLLLKTFIFNIYSIVMNQLRWAEFEDEDK